MELEDYIKRELDNVYVSTLIMKETVYKRENKVLIKQGVYILMGLNLRGYKKIIDVVVPIEDTTGYWYNVISSYKSRGIEEFFMVALTDNMLMNKAFKMVYPNIIKMPSMIEFHNNSRPYILQKNHRKLMSKMQYIYKSKTKEAATDASKAILDKWKDNKILIKKLNNDIPHMLQLFEYSENIRKIVYTTNPIESLNSGLRKVTNGKGCFVNEEALKKVLYLRIKELKEKWGKNKTNNWMTVLNELIILHGERVEKYINV